MLSTVSGYLGNKEEMESSFDKIVAKLENLQKVSAAINKQMKDPVKLHLIQALTTFVAVCIPEFLSMYETERLIQELAKFKIDVHNIVINQVLFPDDECKMCKARSKMQYKYLTQIKELYDDFNVTIMPLQGDEVRGHDKLVEFGRLLLEAKTIPKPV